MGSKAFKRFSEDIVKFWSILYSPHFYHISIPADLEEQSRKTLIQYLPMGLGYNKNQVTPILIFKTYGITSLEAESKFLQHCPFLTIFAHRKGSDDNLLAVLGRNCPVLQVSFLKKHAIFLHKILLQFMYLYIHPRLNLVNMPFCSLNWVYSLNRVWITSKIWKRELEFIH